MLKFHGFPIHITDRWRNGLVVVTEDGEVGAMLDMGQGARPSSLNLDCRFLANQRHRPSIQIECNQLTQARYLKEATP